MNLNKLLLATLIVGISGLSISRFFYNEELKFHSMYPDGRSSIAGNTGAPGESTCASCHGANYIVGGTESTFKITDNLSNVITAYQPSTEYTITFSVSMSGNRKGFQMVALDESDKQAGSFTAGTGTKLNSTNGRSYINHSSASNSSWTFKWTSPATNVGNVTFYVATGNLSSIYASKFTLGGENGSGTASIKVNQDDFKITPYYSEKSNSIFLRFNTNQTGKAFFNLVDLSGKSVHYTLLENSLVGNNNQEVQLPSSLQSGTYIVQVFINNTFATKKIIISK